MSKIALVRHGESEWNKLGIWTGWQDIPLSRNGILEAVKAGQVLKDISFHHLFTSDLIRASETLNIIKKELKLEKVPAVKHGALKERNYGEFTGKNKWQIEKTVGKDRFKKIRRGWNHPIAGGETLKDVYNRVVPFFEQEILPLVKNKKNILISAHGNSIRALIKYLEGISDQAISEIELETGEVVIYEFAQSGKVIKKERRKK